MASTKDKHQDSDALKRMDEALKAALKTPPRKHKDEPKRARTKADKEDG